MITRVHIENFKSVANLDLELGRVNVFIGENGCGKSNILEAIVVASADAHDKLANEFLAPRGVRVTEPQFMRSAFTNGGEPKDPWIRVRLWDAAGIASESAVDLNFRVPITTTFDGRVSALLVRLTEIEEEIAVGDGQKRDVLTG